jgi:flagellar protein FliO/FliZ
MSSRRISTAMRAVLIGFAASFTAAMVQAADKPFAAPQVNQVPASAAGGLAQVTFSLLLVLAAIFAAAWFMKRLRGASQRGGNVLHVVADLSLGPKERAVLVQVGQQQVLVGVAPGQVTALHVLAEPVTTNVPVAQTGENTDQAAPPAPAEAFKAILKRSLGL